MTNIIADQPSPSPDTFGVGVLLSLPHSPLSSPLCVCTPAAPVSPSLPSLVSPLRVYARS
jgi:hypothetical protein